MKAGGAQLFLSQGNREHLGVSRDVSVTPHCIERFANEFSSSRNDSRKRVFSA
jgi:hypothetical protein